MGYITFVAKHDGLTNVSGRLVGKQEGDKEEKDKHSLSTSMVLIYLATVLYNTSIYAQSSQQQDLEGSNDHPVFSATSTFLLHCKVTASMAYHFILQAFHLQLGQLINS